MVRETLANDEFHEKTMAILAPSVVTTSTEDSMFGEAETGLFVRVRGLSVPLPAADRQAWDEALRRLTAMANLPP